MSSLFPRLSRGSQRPISMLLEAGGQAVVSMAADHCQVDSKRRARRRCSSLHHPWVGGVKARSGSPRHCKNFGGHASMPWDGCLGLLLSVLPQLPLMSGQLYEDSYPWPHKPPNFLAPRLGHGEDNWTYPDWTWLIKLGWCTRRAAHLHPSENFSGKAPGDLI